MLPVNAAQSRHLALLDPSLSDNRVEAAITKWLHQKQQRSQSQKTFTVYRDTLTGYRRMLLDHQHDLDSLLTEEQVRSVELVTQAWASAPRSRDGKPVAAATYNLRLNVVSSFYQFCQRRRLLAPAGVVFVTHNPTSAIERRPTQEYASARPLTAVQVRQRLAAIDTRSPVGLRDRALLLVALTTGRRLSELAALCFEDVDYGGGEPGRERITLVFPNAKGGKIMRDTLADDVAQALLAWLRWRTANVDVTHTRVWVSLAHNGTRGRPLALQGIEELCLRRMGVSKVHALRHTFAHQMEQLGAKVSDIQARLGHSSLAVTGRYLAALRSDENTFAEPLARTFTTGA